MTGDLIKSVYVMDQEPGFSTWSQALVLTSCSVIPFATQLLPGYIKEQSTFHLKHTPTPNGFSCKSPSFN